MYSRLRQTFLFRQFSRDHGVDFLREGRWSFKEPEWQKLVGPFCKKVPEKPGTFSQKVPIYPAQRARANTLLRVPEPRAQRGAGKEYKSKK